MNYVLKKDYDVCVVGGGVAGVAAAVASAREGLKTILFEKTAGPFFFRKTIQFGEAD